MAHYLCRTMEGGAILPDGTAVPLLRINDWNFDWQDDYRYAEPIPLPEGTKVWMRYVYDNFRGQSA